MDLTLYPQFPQELEVEWNDLLNESSTNVPFLRFEYLKTWWKTRGGGEWPEESSVAIVTARQDGKLIGIAPLFFTSNWEGKPALLFLGSIEISDYLDFIVRPEDLQSFISALLPFLANEKGKLLPGWERIDLYNLLDSSPTIQALTQAGQTLGWNFQVDPFRPSLYIPLPGDWETYLAGIDKKQRHEIRRKMRRADNGEQGIGWYFVENPANLDAEIDAFLALMEQDPEKARFLTPPMRENFRLTMRCSFHHGNLRLAFFEVDGQKAAAYLNFDYLNQLWVYNSGMDRRFNEYSPGWVLLGNLLQWANENGKTAFDFMRGDEDYKVRFGGQRRDVMRLTLTP